MKTIALGIEMTVSLAASAAVNFFILCAVLRKLNKPEDERKRTRFAAIVAVLLAVPSAINSRRFAEAGIEAARVESELA